MKESNNTQVAEVRTLSGNINRDYFGSNKRVWELDYRNLNTTDLATIKTLYTNYLATAAAVSFQVTEANYTVAAVNVHISLNERSFSIPGSSYLSDITLILTEA